MKCLFPTALCLTLIIPLGAAESKRPTNLEIELDIVTDVNNSSTKQSSRETQNHRIFIKGNYVRREERSVGGTEILVEGSGVQYLFSPEAKQGLKHKAGKPGARPDYPQYFDAEGFRAWIEKTGARKGGSEKVGGVDCDVYMQTEGNGESVRATLKRWLRKDTGLPVKNTLEAESPTGQKTITTMTIKRIRVGEPIDDSLFEAPRGYEIREVTAMPARGKGGSAPPTKSKRSKK